MAEKNKRLVIHPSASLLANGLDLLTLRGIVEVAQSNVLESATQLGRNQYQQAEERNGRLGEPAPNDPLTVAELRPRAHDMLTPTATGITSHPFAIQWSEWKASTLR